MIDAGQLCMAALQETGAELTHWRGWPDGQWLSLPIVLGGVFAEAN